MSLGNLKITNLNHNCIRVSDYGISMKRFENLSVLYDLCASQDFVLFSFLVFLSFPSIVPVDGCEFGHRGTGTRKATVLLRCAEDLLMSRIRRLSELEADLCWFVLAHLSP